MRPPKGRPADALTQVYGFLVAGAVFLVALGSLFVATRLLGQDEEPVARAGQDVQAESLADVLVSSPGIGWEAGPDGVARLGMAAANGSGLSPTSLEAMRGAFFVADAANGKLDYPEAQASLGLDPAGDQQFHIRIYPVGLESVHEVKRSHIRTAYVGDWVALGAVVVATGSDEQMVLAANAQLNLTMFGNAAEERQALRNLGFDFNDRVYITTAAPSILVDEPFPLLDKPLTTKLNVPLIEGDVYPDSKSYLSANLPGRLGLYDVLVVGSNVDHSSLTANAVKSGIRDWVLAGGTLIVFGSDSQAYQWIQPLFHVGVTTVNGAPFAPDVSHPLLKVPHELAWPSYNSHGKGWDLATQGSGAHFTDFSHVIVAGGEDVLAVSNEGAFGDGRIFLTTFRPGEVAELLGGVEGQNFIDNIFLFVDRSNLYLEYGPTSPGDVAVSAAVRESFLWDPELGQVPVRIEVHTWQA